MKVVTFILVIFLQSGSATEVNSCPLISHQRSIEAEKLNKIVMDNEFLSGCVTELISDLKETYHAKYDEYCKTEFSETLDYAQWVNIYNSCMFN